ncbi:MAG: tryptophan synthase subunit alpha [Deltaproteobacteria bacterium RIFCSPLOWO2_02_FULL_50_16]|nr:MAG: tryptophan synthase subunit alpha [Deltaproteobacteria bacterium GWA2_50_8]OGQ26653.1 MAG: tryptophan synthase subunit alpha [Deltaproteobacteria bacterium RIFCSPHIGHO2_02_FULL_50_15]OGQ57769.1 MAG: tryptophan synthase subunit alpha [Deltaproteobacteria bacterium RIFCSPLOWO2_02_FULL_50_16]OGQ68769.1 MAG: tryptophan synthase subunit alpha [Deltaproteobacteria bacterium RIFCSPLOWO2_12_FULL_50_11]
MSRIQKIFRQLKREKKKALIPFITAGDPSLSETMKLIALLEKAGADIIELGMPFSDPMADGPVIQASSERSLKKGTNLKKILTLVGEVRKRSQIPILLMGYYNPVFAFGVKAFAQSASKAGVDAVLIVDVPPEESAEVKDELDKVGIDLIFLVAPTTSIERMKKIAHLSRGFIYYVSMTGVTGASLNQWDSIQHQITQLRRLTRLPIAVGFGISTPKEAQRVATMADGVVIGSALIRQMAGRSPVQARQRISTMIRQYKLALSRSF